jgi:hypothetical protein
VYVFFTGNSFPWKVLLAALAATGFRPGMFSARVNFNKKSYHVRSTTGLHVNDIGALVATQQYFEAIYGISKQY